MGMTSARKLREIAANTQAILAVEILCAAQAIDLRAATNLGHGVSAAHEAVRKSVPHLDGDRLLSRDMEAVISLEKNGSIRNAVEATVGRLQ